VQERPGALRPPPGAPEAGPSCAAPDSGRIGVTAGLWRWQTGPMGVIMKKMTCYKCKGKGHVSGDVCDVCGGLGKVPVPAEPMPPPDPEEPGEGAGGQQGPGAG